MPARRSRLGVLCLVLAACQQPLATDETESPSVPAALAVRPAPNIAPQACQPPPPAGLIAWWKGEGDGTDAVGTNHASPVGTVGYAAGHDGQAFQLDGVSYLQVPDNGTLDLADSFTFDFWFEPQSVGSDWFEGLIGKRDEVTGVTNFGVNFNPIFLGIGAYYNDPTVTGGDDNDQVGSEFESIRVYPPPAPGQFHHFAAVYRQAAAEQIELSMYLDGVMVRQRTTPGSLARTVNDAPLTLGASFAGFEAFAGLLDDVRIYNRALSGIEIGLLASPGGSTCGPTPISIIVRPNDGAGKLPCRSPLALVKVVVLSSATVDASQLDPSSARFGPGSAEEVHRNKDGFARGHLEDVDGDGRIDLVLHFRMGETGLDCQSTEVSLTISDSSGTEYQGTSAVSLASTRRR